MDAAQALRAGPKAPAVQEGVTGRRPLHQAQEAVLVFHHQQALETRRRPGGQQQGARRDRRGTFAVEFVQQLLATIEKLGVAAKAAGGDFAQAQAAVEMLCNSGEGRGQLPDLPVGVLE